MTLPHRLIRLFSLPVCKMSLPFALCAGLLCANTATAEPTQELAASSALVVDAKNGQTLYASFPDRVLPIASLTKLMTAIVVLDAQLPLNERLPIVIRDNPDMQGVYSRLRVGSETTRQELLRLTLMASENRAATSLAHHYPGGYNAFVSAMNSKARELGMSHSQFAEPTGLSTQNQSTARDLVLLVKAAQRYPLIRRFSTNWQNSVTFNKPRYDLDFRNTNVLLGKQDWQITLSKTGYTDAAGRCLVMSAYMGQRPVIFVALNTFGKYTHIADANRFRRWLETGRITPVPAQALRYKHQQLTQWQQQDQPL